MKKTRTCLLLILLIFIISYPCFSQKRSNWTSMDPLSIPLKIRKNHFNKGNIVPNASFEVVKINKMVRNENAIKISQWDIVGDNVQLTDTNDNVYDRSDASQGIHAVKIVRDKYEVKEIDNTSDGIISDFIKVIPANYNFQFDIRLENIFPSIYPFNRFQKRIGKDVNIHLKFYDKNKNELNPGIYSEYVNKKIDNSFKGFAFSNYFYVNKFDWGRVQGKAWNYPFSVGDLPDKCKYIKIFLGLKGSGTMWIDNIDFRLSKWNFTPMERMKPMFKKNYALTKLMIPTPKIIDNEQSLSLRNKNIGIFNGISNSPEAHAAVNLLNKMFDKLKGSSIKIYTSDNIPSKSTDLQIVLINNSDSFSSKYQDAFNLIKNENQGYFIRKEGSKIILGSNNPIGWYYAACSLSQLIDYPNTILDYADITDYPDFKGRTTRLLNYKNNWTLEQDSSLTDPDKQEKINTRKKNLTQQLQDVDFYAFYKINTFYNSYFSLSKRWWKPGNFYKEYYRKIGAKVGDYGNILSLAVQVNPFYHIDMEVQEKTRSDSLRDIFSLSTKDGFNKVINVLKPALEDGAKTVMLAADDYVPHSGSIRGEYTLFTNPDKKRFTNLANAHYYFLNKLKSWLDREYGDVRLEFVPPAYNNWFIDYGRGTSETYFRDLSRHLDPSIVLVWTGNVIRSLSYDMADIHRVTKVYKRKPMVWDNSPYARSVESNNGGYPINYPRKAVMNNIFQPFDIEHPHNFSSYLNSRYYSNLGGFGEINKIKYMTFADFSWNTKDYNPDFSLFKALVQYIGRKEAKLLLKFNDAYYKLVSSWGQLRLDQKHNPKYKCSEDQKKLGDRQIKTMKEAFSKFKSIDNKNLRNELKKKMDSKIDAWYALCK